MDAERAQLRLGGPQRHQDVERLGVMRLRAVGGRRVRLARRMAVVDRDELLAAVVHVAERAQLLARVDAVARRRRLVRVRAADDAAGYALATADEPAGLVRSGRARMRDDLRTQRSGKRQALRQRPP